MSWQETEVKVRAILGPSVDLYLIHPDGVSIGIGDVDITIAYQQLRSLADLFGTTDIVLTHEGSTPDWSELTPGSPANMYLRVSGITANWT